MKQNCMEKAENISKEFNEAFRYSINVMVGHKEFQTLAFYGIIRNQI